MLDYDKSFKTCDVCAREFKVDFKRYYCGHCDKYFYVCPACAARDKIPCRFCGVGLKKKREPLKRLSN